MLGTSAKRVLNFRVRFSCQLPCQFPCTKFVYMSKCQAIAFLFPTTKLKLWGYQLLKVIYITPIHSKMFFQLLSLTNLPPHSLNIVIIFIFLDFSSWRKKKKFAVSSFRQPDCTFMPSLSFLILPKIEFCFSPKPQAFVKHFYREKQGNTTW